MKIQFFDTLNVTNSVTNKQKQLKNSVNHIINNCIAKTILSHYKL